MIKIRKIRTKFLLPIFAILIVSFAGGLWALNVAIDYLVKSQLATTQNLAMDAIEKSATEKRKNIESDIQRLGQKALEQAAILARMPGVEQAYQLALSGNISDEQDPACQQARQQLRQLFKPVVAGYKQDSHSDSLQLHFHLPSSRSLVRLWREGWQAMRNGEKVDISDDLASFRRTVVQINSGKHSPIQGIEVGRGGFAIRGLVAIQTAQQQHLGSAEVLLPFNDLIETAKTDDTQNFVVYMNDELLSVATKLKDATVYPRVGRFVQCATTDASLAGSLVTGELLESAVTQPVSILSGNYYLCAFPVRDFSNQQAGLIVMMQDISKMLAGLNTITTTGKQTLDRMQTRSIIACLALLAIIGSVVLVLTSFVSRALSRAVGAAEAVARGDISQTLSVSSEDEIGVLSQTLNNMTGSLRERVSLVDQIAQGDLTISIPLLSAQDRFGQALQRMVKELNHLISEVRVASDQIASGSNEVSDVSQSLSQGATEQAAALEQINSSMTEIANQTRQNADHALKAKKFSEAASKAADEGNSNMSSMVGAMDEINQASQDISRIIKVIDEIAFQTNLLALNAAVEAARAGQHGKGFAVVAEEVRNLAARSAKAAQETAHLIEGSMTKTENGARIAERTAASLEQIVEEISSMADLIDEVAAAAHEQVEGISQINTALSQIEQVTQTNTASAEEEAAAAEELSSQSAHMLSLVQRFKTDNSAGLSRKTKALEWNP
ncbi:MAG: HAMP domain-containing protein [Desulfuromonadaceae bacterium]|nr:HAMP domain-containing protein [Desulfuromonadaceae bacterium]